ncbi:hypothetical protein ACFV80_43340 [Streptomyces sp. NPDC059862]|uniref:hypothetical protein n=1 Tax=Streptomyces sp. NPDC059862 TaxID=3346975 RepID=UPI003647381D
MRPIRSRFTVLLLTLTTLVVILSAAAAGVEQTSANPNHSSFGVALRSGATLAPPKILDLDADPSASAGWSRTKTAPNGARTQIRGIRRPHGSRPGGANTHDRKSISGSESDRVRPELYE